MARAIDTSDGRSVALKISRSGTYDLDNARSEIEILKYLQETDPNNDASIVRMLDSFYFRGHYVIVFELLGTNLWRCIRSSSFKGMSKDELRSLVIQMLKALLHLKKHKVTHCDLKPENVVYTDSRKTDIKIIDFGSSCTSFKKGYEYVQSRYYRCPEIILGFNYGCAADMWSLGCMVSELATGRPLFPSID